jgi:hypothetical protein
LYTRLLDIASHARFKEKGRSVTGLTTVAGASLEEITAEELPRYIQEQGLRLYKMEGQSNEVTAQYNVILRALQRRSGDADRISALERKLKDAEGEITALKSTLDATTKRLDEQQVIVDESRTGLRLLNQVAVLQLEDGKASAPAPEDARPKSPSIPQPGLSRLPSSSKFLFRHQSTRAVEDASGPQATTTISPEFFQSTPSKDPSFGDLGREIFNLSHSRDFINPPIDAPFEDADAPSTTIPNTGGSGAVGVSNIETSPDSCGNPPSTPRDETNPISHTDTSDNERLQSALNSPPIQDVTSDQHEDVGMARTDYEGPIQFAEEQDGREGSTAGSRSGQSSYSGDSDVEDGGRGDVAPGVEHVHEGAMGGGEEISADSPMELETSASEGESAESEAPVSNGLLFPPDSLLPTDAHLGSLTRRTSSLRTTLRDSDRSQDTSQ